MTLSQFRVSLAAQFVAVMPLKRDLTPEELKCAFARADQLMEAGGYDETQTREKVLAANVAQVAGALEGKKLVADIPQVEVNPLAGQAEQWAMSLTRNWPDHPQRISGLIQKRFLNGDVLVSGHVLKANDWCVVAPPAPMGIEALPENAQSEGSHTIVTFNEPICKACQDTKKNSKGGQCICVQHPVTPIPPAPAAEPTVIQYLTKEYVCESCGNANMLVSLVGREPQTAAYNCNECGFVGEVVFESEGDINDLVATAEKVEPTPVEAPKKRGRKPKNTIEETAPLLEAALNEPTGQTESIPSEPQLPLAVAAFKAPPLPPPVKPTGNVSPPHNVKPSAEIAAAVVAAEQPVGAVTVEIAEVPEINSEAAAAGLASIFDAYPDDKIIKEWESITKKIFDASKGCTIAAAKTELVQRMAGIYTGF